MTAQVQRIVRIGDRGNDIIVDVQRQCRKHGELADSADVAECLPVHPELADQITAHFGDAHPQVHLHARCHRQPVVRCLSRRQIAARDLHHAIGVGGGLHLPADREAVLHRLNAHGTAGQHAVDGRFGFPRAVAGWPDDHVVLRDRRAGGVKCRDRGASRGDAEDEQAGRAGRPDLGHLGIGGEHAGGTADELDHAPAAGVDRHDVLHGLQARVLGDRLRGWW